MSTIDVNNPQLCEFCHTGNPNESKAVLIPWEQYVGWWYCDGCSQTAMKHGHDAMDKRRIISFKCLPRWFTEWGIFNVKRSNGDLVEMILMDFPCASNKNYGGRLAMSSKSGDDLQIYVDMCSEDHTINKRVTLRSLYECNPDLTQQPILELSFPAFVSQENQHRWAAGIMAAVNAGQKKIADMNLDDPSSDTDCEEANDTQVVEGPTTVTYVVESTVGAEAPLIIATPPVDDAVAPVDDAIAPEPSPTKVPVRRSHVNLTDGFW